MLNFIIWRVKKCIKYIVEEEKTLNGNHIQKNLIRYKMQRIAKILQKIEELAIYMAILLCIK
jgi:hypothetical protein